MSDKVYTCIPDPDFWPPLKRILTDVGYNVNFKGTVWEILLDGEEIYFSRMKNLYDTWNIEKVSIEEFIKIAKEQKSKHIGSVVIDNKVVDYKGITKTFHQTKEIINSIKTLSRLGEFDIKISGTCVSIGCLKLSLDEMDQIEKAISELENKEQ